LKKCIDTVLLQQSDGGIYLPVMHLVKARVKEKEEIKWIKK